MTSMEPFARLVKATGDAAAELLDAYKEYYSHVSPSNYHQTIKDIKPLLDLVQELETESLAGAFRATIPRAKSNISGVLNECGQLAKLLHTRVQGRNLRDDASTSRDIQTYCAEIGFFLATYGGSREELNFGASRASRASRAEQYELEDLRHLYEDAQMEIARLSSIIDGPAHGPRDNFSEGSPSECSCEVRLMHIKRLHEAIACLGLRHPREHGLDSWEELKGELPHMLDHIRGINKQLKVLDDPESPMSRTSSRASTAHRRHQSDPQNLRTTSFSRDVRPRPSSPTESNISVSRDSLSAVDAGNRAGKRRSKGTGYFSNQGGRNK